MKVQMVFMLSIVAVAQINTCGGTPHPALKFLFTGGNSMKKILRLVNSNEGDTTVTGSLGLGGSSSSSNGGSSGSSPNLDKNPLTAFVQGVRASRQVDSSSSSDSSKSSSSSKQATAPESTIRTRRGAIDFDLLAMIVRVVLLIIEIEVRIFLKLFGIRLPDFGDDILGFLRQPLQFLESLT